MQLFFPFFSEAVESPCLRKSLRGHDVSSITNTSSGGADNVGTGNCGAYISLCGEMCTLWHLLILKMKARTAKEGSSLALIGNTSDEQTYFWQMAKG